MRLINAVYLAAAVLAALLIYRAPLGHAAEPVKPSPPITTETHDLVGRGAPPAKPDPLAEITKERDELRAKNAETRKELAQITGQLNARLYVLQQQRDEAMNQVVIARADLAVAQALLEQAAKKEAKP